MYTVIAGDVLPPRWWLPSCYREKVNTFKTYISRLVDVLSICKFCFSIEIGKKMASLADCLRQDAPFSVLTQLAVTLEYVADDDTAQIATAIRETADGIAETATIEICSSTDPSEITALVDQLDFYADGIEQGYFNCIGIIFFQYNFSNTLSIMFWVRPIVITKTYPCSIQKFLKL